MEPVEAYKILKEHLTNQDHLIRQKVLGLFISNSVLLVAFFMSMSQDNSRDSFVVFRLVAAAIALFLCIGFTASLFFDIRAKWRTIKGLDEIEKEPDFAYLKKRGSRPITDIEHGARGQVKWRWLVKIGDFFWPLLPVSFIVAWIFTIMGALKCI